MTTRRKKSGGSQSSEATSSLFGPATEFERPELLTWALTHRSLAYETNADETLESHSR